MVGKSTDTSEGRQTKTISFMVIMNLLLAILVIVTFFLDTKQLLVFDPVKGEPEKKGEVSQMENSASKYGIDRSGGKIPE